MSIDTELLTRISAARSDERRTVSEVMAKVRDGYFGNTPDKQLAAAMDDMFDDIVETLGAEAMPSKDASHIGRMAEGYPLFGLGESGTRKSSTFARMIHIRPEFAGFSYVPHKNRSALISVKAPSPCTLRVLGVTIARAMGFATHDTTNENVVWDEIMDNLPKRGIRVIHIDEFQHVLENRNKVDIAKIRNTLKRVLQTPGHPVWMLVTGMPECGPVLEADSQTWRRTSHVFFQELTFSAHAGKCRTMVTFFAKEKAGLDCEAFTTDDNMHRLMHASLFRLGIAIDLVIKSIRVALKKRRPRSQSSTSRRRTGHSPVAQTRKARSPRRVTTPRSRSASISPVCWSIVVPAPPGRRRRSDDPASFVRPASDAP